MNPPLLSLSLLVGTSILFLLPQLPSVSGSILALLLAVVLQIRWPGRWTSVATVLLFGFLLALVNAKAALDSRVPFDAGRIDIDVTGTVTSLVRETGGTLAFQFEALATADLEKSLTLALRWYEFPDDTRRPRPGDVWQLTVRLRATRGSANPGRPFWEDYAFRHGIDATGYVRRGDNDYIDTHAWRGTVERLRDRLSRQLIHRLARYETAPIIVALAVGDRQHLEDSHWKILRRSGLSHLVAISGLHIGIVAGLAYALGAVLGPLITTVFSRLTQARSVISSSARGGGGIVVACLLSASLALVYAALAGFTIPTQRALIVVLVFLTARLCRRSFRPLYALSCALTLVLLLDPESVLDAGFWLSFSAVAVILYSGSGQLARGAMADLWRMQFAVLIGLTPLMIVLFGQVSLAAPLVNFLLLPLFGLLLVPAVLIGVVAYLVHSQTGVSILQLVAELLDRVWPLLDHVAELGLLLRAPGTPGLVAMALAVMGTLWCLAPRGWPARGLGLLCLLPALMSAGPRPEPGSFVVTALDVGQGLSVVVQTHRQVLVFDTGPAWRGGADAASRILVPYLQKVGINNINRLLISHGDNDHAGGLDTLTGRYSDVTVSGSGVDGIDPCQRGQRWFWDGVSFEILHPGRGESWTGNNASCVLRISNEKACVLLTGDIEGAAERALAATMDGGNRLRCTLLLAPHHGSETSSTQEFVTATKPDTVLVSASYSNPWGFPRPAVLRRWRRSGARVFNTANSGAITAVINPQGSVLLQQYRCDHRRFWRPDCRVPSVPDDPASD